MEIEDSNDVLFKDWSLDNSTVILPQVRKCIAESSNEKELLRALEIAFNFCLKYITEAEEAEDELFKSACLASKKIVEDRLKSIEKNPTSCVEGLGVSLQIISFFQRIFQVLNEKHNIRFIEVKDFLIVTSEIVFWCLSHCKISEQVYGSLFGSLAEHLSNFFKSCCVLLEQMLSFLTRDTKCDFDNDSEISSLDKVITLLSKSGIVLINLEVKTMAKVWKAFALLIENHLCLRENHKIEETLKGLCCNISTNMEASLCEDNQDFEKIIKLNCFLLKVVIKLCSLYAGALKNCHSSLLNLLLLLCRWDAFFKTQPKFKKKEDLLNQLTIGTEPLLSLIMRDETFVKEFHRVHESCKSVEFPILCCLILKKLMDCDSVTRSLWFNKKENILTWVLFSASSSEFLSTPISIPNIIISGKQMKFADLYEYVLVKTSAFLMTASSDEYHLVEGVLIENILQTNPIRALLAIDIWCLLARFAGSELCFSQILILSKSLEEILETQRVEKWYLMSLVGRLFPLLSESHKKLFFNSFSTSFYSALWERCHFGGLSPTESSAIRESVLNQIDHVLDEHEETFKSRQSKKCESRVLKLWKFNCEVLVLSAENERFMKILCGLTASVVADLPSEDLFLVLMQIKKLLKIGQPTCVQLYFTRVLKSLSTVFVPPGNFQKKAITAIAEIFGILLSSKQVLVKQRAFETFYVFSHVTSHGEVISLSVQDSSELKLEVTNYFKKTLPDVSDFNLGGYFNELYESKFEHVCPDLGVVRRKIKLDPAELKKILMRWKEDGKRIVECFQSLSESEKTQIKTTSAEAIKHLTWKALFEQEILQEKPKRVKSINHNINPLNLKNPEKYLKRLLVKEEKPVFVRYVNFSKGGKQGLNCDVITRFPLSLQVV